MPIIQDDTSIKCRGSPVAKGTEKGRHIEGRDILNRDTESKKTGDHYNFSTSNRA